MLKPHTRITLLHYNQSQGNATIVLVHGSWYPLPPQSQFNISTLLPITPPAPTLYPIKTSFLAKDSTSLIPKPTPISLDADASPLLASGLNSHGLGPPIPLHPESTQISRRCGRPSACWTPRSPSSSSILSLAQLHSHTSTSRTPSAWPAFLDLTWKRARPGPSPVSRPTALLPHSLKGNHPQSN